MKRIIIIMCVIMSTGMAVAQEKTEEMSRVGMSENMAMQAQQSNIVSEVNPLEDRDMRKYAWDYSGKDSLHLPSLNYYGQARIGMYPMDWCGMYNWDLHSGLNVNIGASVFATFGKHSGAGFGQNIAAMYAVPLTDKLSFAVGGYFNNMYWTRNSYRDAGVNAVLGYKFDEHWEAYLYGQKSLTNRRMPLPLYDMGNLGDRIGAAVRYNFNPNFSIQVSVSTGEMPVPYAMPVYTEPGRR